MRKLLVKLFALDYKVKSNAWLFIGQLCTWLMIASFAVSQVFGYVFCGVSTIFLLIGVIGRKRLTSFPRASAILWPSIALSGISMLFGANTLIVSIFLAIFIIGGFISFVWLSLYPAKFDEMDNSQKWQYGNAITLGVVKNTLTDKQWGEWYQLNDYYYKKFNIKIK